MFIARVATFEILSPFMGGRTLRSYGADAVNSGFDL